MVTIKKDDIIVKVTFTAFCGSDLHLVHGTIPKMPKDCIIRHETLGIVEEVGKEVTRVKKGDRVIVPFPISCDTVGIVNMTYLVNVKIQMNMEK